MIEVDLERCTGCGSCVDACPAEAISIVEGHAQIDDARCQRCEACVSACPVGALAVVSAPVAVVESRVLQARPDAVIDVRPLRTVPVPWRRKVLPALGAVASFTAREVLPWVLEVIASSPKSRDLSRGGEMGPGSQRPPGAGQQHRHRRRGR